jgi:hypothetical protein
VTALTLAPMAVMWCFTAISKHETAEPRIGQIPHINSSIPMHFRDTFFMRVLNSIVRFPAVVRAYVRNKSASGKEKNYLSICAIFKDESRFLDEWIRFHHGVGVAHFYLYDNGSTDDPSIVLDRWIERGIVTLRKWPGPRQQVRAYMDCIKRNWRDNRWIAFIDIDEFLFSPTQVNIVPILRNFENARGIFVYWQVFGSSGYDRRPNIPVVQAYTKREKASRIPSGKSIVNPRFVRRMPNPHNFAFWSGTTIDTDGLPLPYHNFFDTKILKTPKYDRLRINHYWSRSLEDLGEKVARGDAFYANRTRDPEEHAREEGLLNDIEDLAIQPIWAQINGKETNGNDSKSAI